MVTLDSVPWRLTVVVDDDNLITELTQEVFLGRTYETAHGGGLISYIKTGELPKLSYGGTAVINKKALETIEVDR